MANGYMLDNLIEDMGLNVIFKPDKEVEITNVNVNRPGLPLVGHFNFFDPSRIQIIGKSETNYLSQLTPENRYKQIEVFLAYQPKAIIYSWSEEPCDEMKELCKKYETPLLKTDGSSSDFMARLISKLSYVLAPCITRHGVLVEVYGEGVLILGESGIGKSETAIELVKRGHRLIADDAVELRKVSDITVVGSAPELIRHYVELRGIGIIDVKQIFGTSAVKNTEKVELIINLVPWESRKENDRMGLIAEHTEIMDLEIPSYTVPVHPGRNLAVIIEIAAINNRQKRMGYNAAVEFNKKLLNNIGVDSDEVEDFDEK